MLTLEIDHLLGVAFAARGQETDEPDWPPQPDRVFSALTAAWGARGERSNERDALEWLEGLPSPMIAASGHTRRPAPVTFVPPNDPETGRTGNEQVLPLRRRRQPRRFPAALPHDPLVELVWEDVDVDADVLAALNAMAQDTAYVGHSASLTRCRFVTTSGRRYDLQRVRRRIYPGRLRELTAAFGASPRRRPQPGNLAPTPPEAVKGRPRSVFSGDWLVFEIVRGDADLRASALLGKALLRAVMSGYGGGLVPKAVSGHEPDGTPTAVAHLAIVPLANLGWPYSDGDLYGFALAPPRAAGGEALMEDPAFHRALRSVLRPEDDKGQRLLRLHGTGLSLAPSVGGVRKSLDPSRYLGPARVWATATPIVLDRHLKTNPVKGGPHARQAEIEELIVHACANIGLPLAAQVVAGKHSAIAGAPPAEPSGRGPAWMGWRVPEPQRSRLLIHAIVSFADAVEGPVILGAGRHCGLGLCLPVDAGRPR